MRDCGQDDAVLKAVRSGEWSPDLRAHVAACPSCQELTDLSVSLHELVAVSHEGPLPDPRILLRKARLLDSLEARETALARAVRPLDIAATLSLAGAGALLAWSAWSAVPLLALLALLGGLRVVWAGE
jgi:hypothetical protein